jgi:hypothetical protein
MRNGHESYNVAFYGIEQFMHKINEDLPVGRKTEMRLIFVRHNDQELANCLAKHQREAQVIGAIIVGSLRIMAKDAADGRPPTRCMKCDQAFASDYDKPPGGFLIGMAGGTFNPDNHDVWVFCAPICDNCSKLSDNDLMDAAIAEVGRFWEKVEEI